jgi:hypothetical protein
VSGAAWHHRRNHGELPANTASRAKVVTYAGTFGFCHRHRATRSKGSKAVTRLPAPPANPRVRNDGSSGRDAGTWAIIGAGLIAYNGNDFLLAVHRDPDPHRGRRS